jgi:hypothetical protein
MITKKFFFHDLFVAKDLLESSLVESKWQMQFLLSSGKWRHCVEVRHPVSLAPFFYSIDCEKALLFVRSLKTGDKVEAWCSSYEQV